MKHVVLFSFGIGSWATAKLVAKQYGTSDLVLLFTDTKYEDEDTYRWGRQAAANVGGTLVEISDGRDVWQLFYDNGMIANTRADFCSRILKRELADKWLEENCDKQTTIIYPGIHWSEKDRFERWDREKQEFKGIKPRLEALGWMCRAPLCEPPLIPASELHEWAKREGLQPQRLYEMGFPHANCGGRCIKGGGHASWKLLYEKMPERFAECERQEQEFREKIGKDVAILRDRRGGSVTPLPLSQLRKRIELQQLSECDKADFGGCSCFAGQE